MTQEKKEGVGEKLLGRITNFYQGYFDRYGVSPLSVGWEDEAAQELRFSKLIDLIDSSQDSVSVNDFGCGYGALYKFLLEKKVSLRKYYGYDLCTDMLRAARNSIPDEKAIFTESEQILFSADYSFVSGTFNLKLSVSADIWAEYIQKMLLEMAAKSVKGMAFNLLSSYVDQKHDIFYYADPCQYFKFCKRNISRCVSLIHDYAYQEWTMLVKF